MTLPAPSPTSTEQALQSIGLTNYAARAYVALAANAQATAPELSEAARVPRQRIYDVLDSLIGQGLAARGPGKPAVYCAVDPIHAGAELLKSAQDRLAHLEVALSEAMHDLRQSWVVARHEYLSRSGSGAVQPEKSASGRITLADMQSWGEHAQRSVIATARPPFEGLADPRWIARVRQLTAAGGTVRCVYHPNLLEDEHLLGRAAAYAAAGEQARIASAVHTRMIITDSSRALLALPFAASAQTTGPVIAINDTEAVEELKDAFALLWEDAVPLAHAVAQSTAPRGRTISDRPGLS